MKVIILLFVITKVDYNVLFIPGLNGKVNLFVFLFVFYVCVFYQLSVSCFPSRLDTRESLLVNYSTRDVNVVPQRTLAIGLTSRLFLSSGFLTCFKNDSTPISWFKVFRLRRSETTNLSAFSVSTWKQPISVPFLSLCVPFSLRRQTNVTRDRSSETDWWLDESALSSDVLLPLSW